jgi:hypothetical protein
VVVVVAGIAIATGVPHRLDQERREFSRGAILPGQADLRDRLTQTGNNGRIANWRVARDGFEAEPLRGTGAGTYRLQWERLRPRPPFQVSDGHSLYLETASELGLPGLLVLCVALLAPMAVALARLRRPERHATAAFVAAGGALLVHAGVAWDWEIPALFLWFFAAAAVVLAETDRGGSSSHPPGRLTRLLAGLACLGVLLTPALILISQGDLNRGVRAFKRGDCGTAIDASLDSLDVLGVRPDPFELIGYCDARAGQAGLAVRAMREAQQRDPHNWQFAYGLAVAQALAGQDPVAAMHEARRLNPLSSLTRDLERRLRSPGVQRRRRAVAHAAIPFE